MSRQPCKPAQPNPRVVSLGPDRTLQLRGDPAPGLIIDTSAPSPANISMQVLQRIQVIKPFMPYSHVLHDRFLLAVCVQRMSSLPPVPHILHACMLPACLCAAKASTAALCSRIPHPMHVCEPCLHGIAGYGASLAATDSSELLILIVQTAYLQYVCLPDPS